MTYTVYFSADLRGTITVDASCKDEAEDKVLDMTDAELLDSCYRGPSEVVKVNDIEAVSDYGID